MFNFTIVIYILLFCIIFYSISITIIFFVLLKKLKNTRYSLNNITSLYDDLKSFKHDFENMVTVIGGFIDTNDMENLRKYYKSLFDDCEKLNRYSVLNPEVVNNSGIYNLLIKKFKKAENNNVKINLDCFIDFNNVHMPIYELSRILGIFIDNAIEAASSSFEKCINISFRDSKANSSQIIIVENTYINKDVDTSKIFENGISSKENHLGVGLWKVKGIIDSNKNINLVTTKNDKYFRQQLEIYY